MSKQDKKKIEAAAAASVGATLGGGAGATVGVLELVAQEVSVNNLTAGLVIGFGVVVGGLLSLLGYRAYCRLKKQSRLRIR